MPLRDVVQYRKSYRAGLLQANAFRILKKRTNDALQPFDLNATDWGILGLLLESRSGLQLKQIAQLMGVKPPYVTRSVQGLVERKFISLETEATDARSKVAVITPDGAQFVNKTEPVVMRKLLESFAGINKRDALGYVATLAAIVEAASPDDLSKTDLDHIQ